MRSDAVGLREWMTRQDLTMEELVETAEALVGSLVPKQTKYKVAERPDARTIRFYVTQGLLPKPVGYDGGRARYSGSHLLRLVCIKKMQAEHYTLAKIGSLLAGSTDEQWLAALEAQAEAEEAETETASPPPPPQKVAAAPENPGFAITPETEAAFRRGWGSGGEAPGNHFLADPEKRKKLAESLEQLAAWLRQGI